MIDVCGTYLEDHRIFDQVVVPATAILEMAQAAAQSVFGPGLHAVEDLVLQAALVLSEDEARRVQLVLSDRTEGPFVSFTLYSQPVDAPAGEPWKIHAVGRVRADVAGQVPEPVDLSSLRSRCPTPVSVAQTYARLAEAGVQYGPAFQGLSQLWRGQGEALAHIVLPEAADVDSEAGYLLHPALLDAALHTFAAVFATAATAVHLPFAVARYVLFKSGARQAWVSATSDEVAADGEVLSGTVTLWDSAGQPIAAAHGVRLRRTDAATLRRAGSLVRSDWLYQIVWRRLDPAPVAHTGVVQATAPGATESSHRHAGRGESSAEPVPPGQREGNWIVGSLGPPSKIALGLVARLSDTGATVQRCASLDELDLALSTSSDQPPAGIVVFCIPEEAPFDPSIAEDTTISALKLLQGLQRAAESWQPATLPGLWWVTVGSQAVAADERPDLSTAPLWGLGRA